MTKRLLLLRHGKSDWDAPFEEDRDRPLAKRGIKAAKLMGRLLAAVSQVPDAVLTSPAVRARTTVELSAESGQWACPIRVVDALYDTTPDIVLSIVRQEGDAIAPNVQTLMLVGHQPTWSNFAARAIGGGAICIPTATLVVIEFEVETWQAIDLGLGELVGLVPPRFIPHR